MLLEKEKRQFAAVRKTLKRFDHSEALSLRDNRFYFETLRWAFRFFEDLVQRLNASGEEIDGKEGRALRSLIAANYPSAGTIIPKNSC